MSEETTQPLLSSAVFQRLPPALADALLLVTWGVDFAVVESAPAWFSPLALERVVSGLGLGGHFAAVVGPELARRRKPSPQHVLAALEAIGRRPPEAVMIGDSPGDIVAGRRAGTATVAVLWGYRSRRQLAASAPDRLVASVAELGAVLRR